ncbi:MAG: hypothetical protein R2932_56205 [Caldilineaceae bacterium]
MSLGGVHLLRRHRYRWLGCTLILTAIVIHQSAALAGLLAWVIVQGLHFFQQDRMYPGWAKEGLWLMSGYAAGALASRALISFTLAGPGRAALPSSVADKVHFWLEVESPIFSLSKLSCLVDGAATHIGCRHNLLSVIAS